MVAGLLPDWKWRDPALTLSQQCQSLPSAPSQYQRTQCPRTARGCLSRGCHVMDHAGREQKSPPYHNETDQATCLCVILCHTVQRDATKARIYQFVSPPCIPTPFTSEQVMPLIPLLESWGNTMKVQVVRHATFFQIHKFSALFFSSGTTFPTIKGKRQGRTMASTANREKIKSDHACGPC